jgi:threonine dehydrogenase-like Zn-dependent dehydrogenase
MKALCWMGSGKTEIQSVNDPEILNPHDAVIKVTRTAICGPTCIYSMASFRPWKKATF